MSLRSPIRFGGRWLSSRHHKTLFLLLAVILVALVGCRFSNPVGVEKATQNTATRAALVPSHRAPIDPVGGGDGELAVPQNLQISDVGWAWSVKWDASDH